MSGKGLIDSTGKHWNPINSVGVFSVYQCGSQLSDFQLTMVSDRGGGGSCAWLCVADAISLGGLWNPSCPSGPLTQLMLRQWLYNECLSNEVALREFIETYRPRDFGGNLDKSASDDAFYCTDPPPSLSASRLHILDASYQGDNKSLAMIIETKFFRQHNLGIYIVDSSLMSPQLMTRQQQPPCSFTTVSSSFSPSSPSYSYPYTENTSSSHGPITSRTLHRSHYPAYYASTSSSSHITSFSIHFVIVIHITSFLIEFHLYISLLVIHLIITQGYSLFVLSIVFISFIIYIIILHIFDRYDQNTTTCVFTSTSR